MKYEIDGLETTLHRRGWLARILLGHPEYRVDIHLTDRAVVSGEGETEDAAWRGAAAAAEILGGVTITDPNPFPPRTVSGSVSGPLPPARRLPRHGDPDPTPRVLRHWRF